MSDTESLLGTLEVDEEDVTRWPEDGDVDTWIGEDADEDFGGGGNGDTV